MNHRGDVVIVEFPYVSGGHGKIRPALVIQNDRDNARLSNTIVAMISGNIRHARQATQLLVDPSTAEGQASGLHGQSVVKCANLFTVRQQDVIRTIGSLTTPQMLGIDNCLKAALGIS